MTDIPIIHHLLWAPNCLIRFGIYQDITELGFWIFVVFSLGLVCTGIYLLSKYKNTDDGSTN